jgi:sterol desaturase/sphingolipid hydroxylase (fatty acid hydroxylase superfamily)
MDELFFPLTFAAFALLALAEHVWPARAYPARPRWRLRGVVAIAVYFALATALPMLWDEALATYRIFDLTGLGLGLGAFVGVLVVELFQYVWHRTMHAVPFLWRWFHQMHHSAERIDVFGALYFSPLDVLGFTLASSLALVLVVGLSPEATTLATLIVTWLAFFQHANIRTPRWLGYFVQRPESHALHHARGVHRYNYADIPLFDLLFGTFRNPARVDAPAGFYDGASERVAEMLIGRDVSEPKVTFRAAAGSAASGEQPGERPRARLTEGRDRLAHGARDRNEQVGVAPVA